jgi:hypothetical protein
MPETSDIPVTTAHLTAILAGLAHAPTPTPVPRASPTWQPRPSATSTTPPSKAASPTPPPSPPVTASLATAAYRLPQLLNAITEWLRAETAAGRIADDHGRSPGQLTDRIRAAITQTADSAAALAADLAAVHNPTATLHTAEPADAPSV